MDLPNGSSEAPFSFSMLVNDKRYRGYTFQFIALLVLIFAMAYLGWNLTQNLAAKGLNISYQFLRVPAGYDINQRLIEYTSQSTHLRASIVGVLNTLLIAFLGCIMATVIGVFAGILRLSNNWIVAKLMAIYVEIFRNVPVLIWILIISGIFIVALPQPRSFRGENPEATMLWDAFAFTGRGIYTPKPLFNEGSSFVIVAFLLSLAAIFAYRRYAREKLYSEGVLLPTRWPSIALFFVPTVVVFFIAGSPIGVEYPELKGFNFKGGIWARGSLIALWFALSIYTGAFIAENVRAGIQAISKGQTEAAAALGMRPNFVMNLVVLPQALRVIIPPLISQYLNLTKKQLAGYCSRLYGYNRHTGRNYVEPDRACD
jgi:general L-amino acid transport system permease protein